MTALDTHTLDATQVRRLLTDVDAYQLARFGGCTYYICPSGELDYHADRTITERVDQLQHQHPGLITVIYPLEGSYEQLWSLTDAGREHLARLRTLTGGTQ